MGDRIAFYLIGAVFIGLSIAGIVFSFSKMHSTAELFIAFVSGILWNIGWSAFSEPARAAKNQEG